MIRTTALVAMPFLVVACQPSGPSDQQAETPPSGQEIQAKPAEQPTAAANDTRAPASSPARPAAQQASTKNNADALENKSDAAILTNAADEDASTTQEAPHFSYTIPPSVATIPALRAMLLRESRIQRDALNRQQRIYRERIADGPQADDFSFDKDWTVAGRTPRLLSISATWSTYEGGAHPNKGFDSLIWDLDNNVRLTFDMLFSNAEDAYAVLRPAYCRALNTERAKRRDEAYSPVDIFNACPQLDDQIIVPASTGETMGFDQLEILLGPYVAGPYSEGSYMLSVDVTPELIAALRPEFRSAFIS